MTAAAPVRSADAPDVAPPRLAAYGTSAWHGDRAILQDVSLAFPAGRITALVGPSGCGKSTLLRCLNRLHETTPGARVAGRILLDGDDVHHPAHDVEALRRAVGMVFQRPTPFPAWSIGANVAAGLGAQARPLDARARAACVERALAAAGLWQEVRDRLDASPLSLSGGQQQRLCLARALAAGPRALLLDEPTSALDVANALRLERTFAALRASMAVVLVTHDLVQARRLADHVAVLWEGRVIAAGTPAQVLDDCDDPRVRALVEA